MPSSSTTRSSAGVAASRRLRRGARGPRSPRAPGRRRDRGRGPRRLPPGAAHAGRARPRARAVASGGGPDIEGQAALLRPAGCGGRAPAAARSGPGRGRPSSRTSPEIRGLPESESVREATADYLRIGLYGPRGGGVPDAAGRHAPAGRVGARGRDPRARIGVAAAILESLAAAGSSTVSEPTAEVLRVEAGRPRLSQDATEANLAEEVGLEAAISATKGCYVGQEIVARMRTYGRVNRRLAGFRFPSGAVSAGTTFPDPEKPQRELGARDELGRFAALRPDRAGIRVSRRRRRRRPGSARRLGAGRRRVRAARSRELPRHGAFLADSRRRSPARRRASLSSPSSESSPSLRFRLSPFRRCASSAQSSSWTPSASRSAGRGSVLPTASASSSTACSASPSTRSSSSSASL